MGIHDYTPEQALELLMRKLRHFDEHLADEIQEAINAGKDVAETEQSRNRRKKPRIYRKTVPYSFEEALQIAIAALQAHFIEQPLFANSCAANFAKAAIDIPKKPQPSRYEVMEQNGDLELQSEREEKVVVIEMQTETQISRTGQEVFELKTISEKEIEEQKQNLKLLKEMLDFS